MTAGGPTPLVVTADDYGLTDATSRAILGAHRDGVVTAVSALVLPPGGRSRLAWLADEPDLAVGAHLAMVGEDPPLLTAREVPTLVDRHGRLPASWRQVVPRLAAGRIDLDDVRREFEAQLEAVAAHAPVSHLDTHQHLHLWPSVARVVVDLAVRHDIGRVRVPRPSGTRALDVRGRSIGRLSAMLEDGVRASGRSATDRYRGLDEAGGWTLDRLVGAIRTLADGSGSVEINTHPGIAADPGRGRYAWSYGWADELAALRSPALRAEIESAGFVLAPTTGPADR